MEEDASMTDAYIKHGFLAAVYEPWMRFEGSEWQDCMQSLWTAYDAGIGSMWDDDEMEAMEKILRSHLDGMEYEFIPSEEDAYDPYGDYVLAAQLSYPETVADWAHRSKGFGCSEEKFWELEKTIPAWMRPPSTAVVEKAKRDKLEEQLAEFEKRAQDIRDELAKLS